MKYAEVSMEAATATTAFFGPRRLLSRRYCARRPESLARVAAQAACTRVDLSQTLPGGRRVERRLPALSSLRGHNPAHETRWPALGKRYMSKPISASRTRAVVSLTPGMVVRSSAER